MDEELWVFHHTCTWDIVLLPSGLKSISYKLIHKIKPRCGGSAKRYKARLVACGFLQEYGIGYEEIFAPIVKMTSNSDSYYLLLQPINVSYIRWTLKVPFLTMTCLM